MQREPSVPAWLWRAANAGLIALVLGLALLALLLLRGAADPPRAGPLQWEDDFKHGLARWKLQAPEGVTFDAGAGALVLRWDEAGSGEVSAWAVTPGPAGDFTLEVAGASGRAAYGLVFGWRGPDQYQAVLLNGAGYAEAYAQRGAERQPWFAWQQWPHILAGADSNRLRIDVRGAYVTARINDEILASTTLAEAGGQIGLMARAMAPAEAVFSWARLWTQ